MSGAPRRTGSVQGRPATWLEAGSGPPLVLLHGAGGSAEHWRPPVGALAAVARVLAPDLPGHGPVPPLQGLPPAPSIAAYADWIDAFLESVGAGHAVVAGHSMGGAVAQALALAHPAGVDGLILVGTAPRLRVLTRILDLLRDRPIEGRDLVQSLSFAAGADPALVALVARVLGETLPLVTLGDFMACDRFDVRDRLGEIRVPTLILTGTEDRLTPLSQGRLLADGIPGARLVEVSGAGHFPQLEQPARVTEAILAFLATLHHGAPSAGSRHAGG